MNHGDGFDLDCTIARHDEVGPLEMKEEVLHQMLYFQDVPSLAPNEKTPKLFNAAVQPTERGGSRIIDD